MDGTARSPARRPIEALTGLRFFAALLVVVSHFPQIIPIDSFQVTLVRQGAAGVTIFFVLSGFVLTYNYADAFRNSTAGTLAFMRARIARIWPISVVSLAITTSILLWWANTSSAATWVVNLLMLQALVPTKAMLLSWNPPAWFRSSAWRSAAYVPQTYCSSA
jgi:peptidoglycan/LPS O-acetylase OafA/YrhL